MRFRDDKPAGNHKSVVDKIIQSIIDGVEKEDVSLFRASDLHDRSTHFSVYLTAPGTERRNPFSLEGTRWAASGTEHDSTI